MNKLYFSLFLLMLCIKGFSQVGIGTTSPHSSAILDLTSQNKGFLPPRVALMGKNDIITIANPISGLLIYNTATAGTSPYNVSPGYYYFNVSSWVSIATGVPDATIDFSVNADPNTVGTTFSPNTPQSKDYIYVSTIDGSQWTWNGTSYVIYIATKTPFYLNNTTNDAGNSKINAVYRNGAIGINQSNPKFGLDVSNSQIRTLNTSNANQILLDPVDTAGPKLKLGTSTDSLKYMEIGAYNGVNNIDNKTRDLKIFNSGASNVMIVKSSTGYIGLGTSTPSTQLDVNGTGLFRNGNTNNAFTKDQILFGFGGTNTYQHAIKSRHASSSLAGNAIDFFVWNQASDATTTVGTKQVMTLDGNGNVGIGTTTPPNPLSIVTNANVPVSLSTTGNGYEAIKIASSGGDAGINLYGGNNYWTFQSTQSDGSFRINDRGAPNATAISTLTILKSTGNVGLGTNTPVSKLDVNGTGLFRNGNLSSSFTNNQLLFGFAGTTTYQHAIKTRHYSGGLSGNAIDFYVWDHTFDAISAIGTKHVMTLDGNGNIGVNTTTPISQLANTNTAIVGSDGKQAQSFNFSIGTGSSLGYVGAFYNSLNDTSYRNGLAVKVAQATATTSAFDVSQGASAGTAGNPLLAVLGNGNTGIKTNSPSYNLDVNGTARIVTLPAITTASDVLVPDPSTGQISKQSVATINRPKVKEITADYTLTLADEGYVIYANSSSTLNITVPSMDIGYICEIIQEGTGQVILINGAGNTLRSSNGFKSRTQYSSISVKFKTTGLSTVTGDSTI